MERISTALPGSAPRRPVAHADAEGLAAQLTSAPSAPVASQTAAARGLVGIQRPPSVPALSAQAQGRTHTAIGAARASAGDTGPTRRRSQRWTRIHPAPGRAPGPATDGQARQRGVPPTPAQDVATQVRLGLRIRTQPRRFSITHPRRPRTSDPSDPVVAALSFDNEEGRPEHGHGDLDSRRAPDRPPDRGHPARQSTRQPPRRHSFPSRSTPSATGTPICSGRVGLQASWDARAPPPLAR
jgi:hypothetical protein